MLGNAVGTLRWIFFALDSVVYGLIGYIYNLFVMITEATFLSQETISEFANRIYVLISLIMTFRLAFSFINYIVKPEELSDKQKGGTKLITNIIVTVVLLASVPTIFNELYYLQHIIVKEQVIERVILGDTGTALEKDSDVGEGLAARTFLAFFRPNVKVNGCNVFTSDECINNLDAANPQKKAGTLFLDAYSSNSLKKIWGSEIQNIFVTSLSKDYIEEKAWGFDYMFGISTVGGIAMCWILLGFCFDVAVRTVKLAVLQLIAPIPIIMNLSPSSKNKTISNWIKEVGTTWASLFIRILVITFSIYLIDMISKEGGIFSFVSGGGANNVLVTVFITFGILLFAKEFPKLLEDLFGIKGAGKLTLNPWKKLGSVPLVGGAATAGATLAGAAALAGGRGLWGLGKSTFKGLGSAIGGNGFGAGFKDGLNDTGARASARMQAGFKSSKEKFTSAGLKGTDKLGGSMHKAYAENIKDYNKARKEMKEYDRRIGKGQSAVATLKSGASSILDKITAGEEISNEEKQQVYDAYRKAYKGDSRYSDNEANLAMAKSKQDYLKKTVGQLERLANANPEDKDIANRLNVAQKALGDTDKQVSGLEEIAKSMAANHKASAEISKAIKVTKGYNNRANVSYKNKTNEEIVDLGSASVGQLYETASETSSNRQQDLQDAIVGAINQGFANMNGSAQSDNRNWTINGVPVHVNNNGDWVDSSGNVVNGTPEERVTPSSNSSQSTTDSSSQHTSNRHNNDIDAETDLR